VSAKAGVIALDLDGTVLNYNHHAQETRVNPRIMDLLPKGCAPRFAEGRPVVIVTNQGGMAFHRANPAKYPSPAQVADRLWTAAVYLSSRGYPVQAILVSCYHPRAERAEVLRAARQLRREYAQDGIRIFTTARARKPRPYLLRLAGATCYYGDSPEDAVAAEAAKIPFVQVARFE